MSTLSFGIRLGAKDDTQGGLRGALAGIASFARRAAKPITIPLRIGRRGLALARDINLGLAPIVRGIDNLIERGTGLEVVRKSFESLTGKGGLQAEMYARRLTQAASGTIRLGKAMQIANRALSSGISFNQLLTAMDFVSKKAITTGISSEMAINKVITGLARGSVLFLDDFGILVDGLEGVKRAYNSIEGAGAWESLGPAAQKAETIRQAIGEMQGQLGRIGVTGKETVFTFKAIKTSVADAVDKLFMAVGRSGALKEALEGVRDTISGMMRHVKEGGSISELLFGKKGGESGGLFGFLKAGLLDAGEALGRGILGGILKGLSKLPELFSWASDKLKDVWAWAIEKIPPAITQGLQWLKDGFLPALAETFAPLVDVFSNIHTKIVNALASWLHNNLPSLFSGPQPGGGEQPGLVEAFGIGVGRAGAAIARGFERIWSWLTGREDPGPIAARTSSNPFLTLAGGVHAAALAQTSKPKTPSEILGEKGDKLLGGGILARGSGSRVRDWFGLFGQDFPKLADAVAPKTPIKVDDSALALSDRGISMRRQRINLLKRDIQTEEGLTRREARRLAGQVARQKRREGFEVTRADQARFAREIFDQLIKRRAGGNRARAAALGDELVADDDRKQRALQQRISQSVKDWEKAEARAQVGAFVDQAKAMGDKVASAAAGMQKAVEEGRADIGTLVSAAVNLIAELSGVKSGLATVGRRRS